MKIIIVTIVTFAYAKAENEQPITDSNSLLNTNPTDTISTSNTAENEQTINYEERIESFLRAALERTKHAMKVGEPPLWVMDPITGDHISWNKTQFEK